MAEQEMLECIRPVYVSRFQCDGAACGSRCCKDWIIDIDPVTYQRYSELEPETERERILSWIERREGRTSFSVKMPEDFVCPFLDEDFLCSIQKRYGEGCLSNICRTYPRVSYRIGDRFEQSLAMTCPVAARQILLSDPPMKFERKRIPIPEQGTFFDWTEKRLPFRALWLEIQQAGLRLLQDRQYALDRRLLHLLYLFERLDHLRSEEADTTFLCGWLEAAPMELPLQCSKRDIEFQPEVHAARMAEVFDLLYDMAMGEEKKRDLRAAYMSNRRILPAIGEFHGTILENYMANEFFLRLYPYAYGESFLYSGKVFVTGCKAVEFALFLTAIARQGRLGVEEALSIIDRMAERLDHSRDGMKAVRRAVKCMPLGVDAFAKGMLDV